VRNNFYLTTPLYYVNDVPHIGHSYTNVLADCIARFRRLQGRKVFFLTGTDEHGDKIARAAKAEGVDPQAFVDKIAPRFEKLWTHLGISHDDFIRTTQERHTRAVQTVLERLHKKGDIFSGDYQGYYCTPCETFWSGGQLVEGKCPDCGRSVETLEEKNWFFKLSEYQSWLIEHIQANPQFILPKSRRNEILSFLKTPLLDLCISRPRKRLTWGIEMPFDKDYVTYVWFDALINYISGCGFPENGARLKEWWPCDIQLIGKDILRHHAVIWPIMLKALDLDIPKTILAHGWWTVDGEKMSKSKGNVVDPYQVINEWGRDAYRYFLLREVPVGQDGDFSEEAIGRRYQNELGNDLGNLVNRVFSMVKRYRQGVIPGPASKSSSGSPETRSLIKDSLELPDQLEGAMAQYDFKKALEAIWRVVDTANRYVEETKPWELAKQEDAKLDEVLYTLCEVIRILAIFLGPFVPDTALKISEILGVKPPDDGSWKAKSRWGELRPKGVLGPSQILFPRKDEIG
jgi:methionyl-tRNA synthetase